ncbi:MAG: Uma2 family endonuclease [Pyrinomonadaceae bacterium]|nr:Uma2 family endonuclease [Pyrinomonadaceae bacterium]
MSLPISRHFFTVAEFERMGQAGVFSNDARLELIEGEIIEMSPIGTRHAACVKYLSRILNHKVGDVVLVSTQDPIRLNDFSEPQPDVALLKLRDDFYRNAHPTPGDVLLVIEVADTTVEYDRQVKAADYAKAGIREMWLVNIPAERIEVYADPVAGEYRIVNFYQRGEDVKSHTFAGLSVSVNDVLG